MSTEINDENNGLTFDWNIMNISHCWLERGEHFEIDIFHNEVLEGEKFLVYFNPIGKARENIGFYLRRSNARSGPSYIELGYELTLLDKNHKFLSGATGSYVFGKNEHVLCKSVAKEEISRDICNPEDTLTVHYKIWNENKTLLKWEHFSALTVFRIHRGDFALKIKNFSTLKPVVRNKFEDSLVKFDIVLKEGLDSERKLVLEGVSFHYSIKYFSFKTCVVNSEGKKEDWGRHEYFAADLKNGIVSPTLLFTKMLMENKNRYLPNDVLTLDCEYIYSTGTASFQFYGHGKFSSKEKMAIVENGKEHDTQLTPVLANDLKSMCKEGVFSDTELRTSTQTFPAHKNILSARSSVFRRMFSNDTENSGHVDVAEFQDDIVKLMLLYLYTDTLEGLKLENALDLFAVAVQFEILSLRNRISSFLKKSLCTSKVCDILILAHRHNDSDLKMAAQNFILEHDKEVFGSEEWKHLMDSNIHLAGDIMYRKVYLG